MNTISKIIKNPESGDEYKDCEDNIWNVVMNDEGFYHLEMDEFTRKTTIHSYLWNVISIEGLRHIPKKVKVTKTIEYWANVYKNGHLDCYPTEGICNQFAGVDRISCVKMTGTYETEESATASAVLTGGFTADAVCAHEWNYFGVCTKCLEKIAPGKCEHKIGITGLCMKCLTNFNVK